MSALEPVDQSPTASPLLFVVPIPRHAFTPREVARASDLWRTCQDVALEASAKCGWPPSRYQTIGGAYLMRQMTVVHQREIGPDSHFHAQTWVSENRRDTLSVREIRLFENSPAGEPAICASQQWAYVDRKEGLKRAPKELIESFPLISGGKRVALPELAHRHEGSRVHEFELPCLHIWRDAMGHLNHPDYVDLCDEGTMRGMLSAGLATEKLVSRGERVTYRSSINAGDLVRVRTTLLGTADGGGLLFDHELHVGDRLCAEAVTWRSYTDGDEALARPWQK